MKDNFGDLKELDPKGSGIVIGMTPSGNYFTAFYITENSKPKQARKLVLGENTGVVRAETILNDDILRNMFGIKDSDELERFKARIEQESTPSMYPAIVPIKGMIVSGNAHTELLYSFLKDYHGDISDLFRIGSDQNGSFGIFGEALREPFDKPFFVYDGKSDKWISADSPSQVIDYNNRINGFVAANQYYTHDTFTGDDKWTGQRSHSLHKGSGTLRTTRHVGLIGSNSSVGIHSETAEDIVKNLYATLGEKSRVAAAVMLRTESGNLDTMIINKYEPS